MGGIQCFVAENTIDAEVFGRYEAALLIGQFVEHTCADSRRVCAQQVLLSLFQLPVVPETRRQINSFLFSEKDLNTHL